MSAKYEIITTKWVQSHLNVSATTAWRYIRLCRDAIGKKEHQLLLVSEFLEYYGIDKSK